MCTTKWDKDSIINKIEEVGYVFIEFVNFKKVSSRIKVWCGNPEHDAYEVCFNNFNSGNRCSKCSKENVAEKFKFHYEDVQKYIESFGYELLSNEYKNNRVKLDMKCPEGHIFKMRFSDFKNNNRRCPICSGVKKYEFEEVNEYVESFGYKLLSTEYVNAKEQIIVTCPNEKHDSYGVTFDAFKNNKSRCMECAIENRSGEKNHNYNPNKTDEERNNSRSNSKYRQFVKDVLKLSDYTCQVTSVRGGKLVVHHLNGYNWHINGRMDVNNVVVISQKIHMKFHAIYGYGYNTKEQWEEFVKMQELIK